MSKTAEDYVWEMFRVNDARMADPGFFTRSGVVSLDDAERLTGLDLKRIQKSALPVYPDGLVSECATSTLRLFGPDHKLQQSWLISRCDNGTVTRVKEWRDVPISDET